MDTLTKNKISFLKGLISTQLGMAADCDEGETDFWNHLQEEYSYSRSILIDYDPSEAENYSESFLEAVNKWIDEINESFKEV